ncbi:C-3',4' desaturase CrtD [Geminocystis herdmanii]|uniref:C-3',4' desaturase CrtD n=1 Tax=Geminocystis herdmanii TaxID=669359 RepID=UPI0003460995|nr:C-3',4' desaturase CrtD [Geminocystis herdmanii]
MGKKQEVIVIGAGIGGLTTGALLAHDGYDVTIYDQAIVPGGCASTFQRKGFTFDVGATQVAGLEEGGIHHRIFQYLQLDILSATECDPACAVFLPQEKQPIMVWRNPEKWRLERERQFPNSKNFWALFQKLFEASWRFQSRDPILPPRNLWDLGQLIQALRLDTFVTVPFTLMTVADALRLFGLSKDRRLKTFLDMQLKLYSQVDTEETALLYAATALSVSQSPQGLYHLDGSMQVLSDRLVEGLKRDGGKLYMRHLVQKIHTDNGKVTGVTVKNLKTGEITRQKAHHVVGNLTVNNLATMTENIPVTYSQRVEKLPPASGAFVIYLGVDRTAIPDNCPPHLQFLYDYDKEIGEINSLFVSVSKQGDGRAPEGKATIIASSFTDINRWWNIPLEDYEALKQDYTNKTLDRLKEYFNLTPETIIHQEIATPVTFYKYTAREKGIVGGIGQRISTFGPFGFATRTPLQNLWLVGDSTHPGEGTAGVSYSALTVVRQIQNN